MRKFATTFAIAAAMLVATVASSQAEILKARLKGGTLILSNGAMSITFKNAPNICGWRNNLRSIRTVIKTSPKGYVNVAFTPTVPCSKVCLMGPVHGVCGLFYVL